MSERNRPVRYSDWIIYGLRLVLLVVATTVMFTSPYRLLPAPVIISILFVLVTFNIVLVALLVLKIGLKYNTILQITSDLLLAIFAYIVTGAADALVVWLVVFAVVQISLTPYWWAGIIVATVIPAFYALLFWLFNPAMSTNSFGLLGLSWLLLTVLAALTSFAQYNRGGRRGADQREAALQQAQDDARTQVRIIYDMAQQVSTSLDPNRVLDAALDVGESGLRTTAGEQVERLVAIALIDQNGALTVVRTRRASEEDAEVVIPGKRGVVAQALKTGQSAQLPEPYNDPELQKFAAIRAAHSLLCIPLRVGGEGIGVMLFAHPQPNFFSRERSEMLVAISNQAVVAFQNARLYQTLRDEKERIVEVEEEARKKLARDLHDGPTQQVAALAMRTNFIRRLVERDPEMAVEELYKVEELARRTTKEIRQMLFTLRPLILESQGLTPALHSLAEKMRENHDQNVIIQSDTGIDERLDKHVQGVLFYIIEEAVGNARKHAEAEHIWVRLRQENTEMLRLDIEDDGVGFNVGEVDASYDQRTSLGMVNMRERTELVNGQLKIQSAVGKGTRIRIRVPLTEEARERLHAV